jgi:mannan endo-1,4-beta-mannosidase
MLAKHTSPLVAFTLSLALACSGRGFDEESASNEEISQEVSAAAAAPACASVKLTPSAAYASSSETTALGPELAIDSSSSTRWSSAFADPQWLALDLGADTHIDRVVLSFEAAASKSYSLLVSDTGRLWNTVYTQTNGAPGPVTVEIAGVNSRARHVQLYSTARTTNWGVSLFDFAVYGDTNAACSSTYRIESVHSQKAVDVAGVSTADGANIQQWSYGGGANQQWTLESTGLNQYQIKSVHSGKCLDIAGPSSADGANVHQWTCHTGTSQRWNFELVASGRHRLVNVYSGKCLDVAGFSTQNGGNLQQWSCSGSANQQWLLSSVP